MTRYKLLCILLWIMSATTYIVYGALTFPPSCVTVSILSTFALCDFISIVKLKREFKRAALLSRLLQYLIITMLIMTDSQVYLPILVAAVISSHAYFYVLMRLQNDGVLKLDKDKEST